MESWNVALFFVCCCFVFALLFLPAHAHGHLRASSTFEQCKHHDEAGCCNSKGHTAKQTGTTGQGDHQTPPRSCQRPPLARPRLSGIKETGVMEMENVMEMCIVMHCCGDVELFWMYHGIVTALSMSCNYH